MTVTDNNFEEFCQFYANYRETKEELDQKVQRFRESKLYASMGKDEEPDVTQPIDENLTFEDGSIHNPYPSITFLDSSKPT